MNTKILAAIVGAITAYIEDEESIQATSEDKLSFWRLSGKLMHMNHYITAGQIIPRPSSNMWKYYGLERLMTARAEWNSSRRFPARYGGEH